MKKVFVFGAGASCAAGAPLGNELVWRYHVDCRLPVPHITEEVPDNSEENERFRNYEKFLSLADSVWPDRKFVEQWRSRGEYVFYQGLLPKNLYVDELLQFLQKEGDEANVELIRTLIFEHIVGATFDNRSKLYNNFILKNLKHSDPIENTVISINFDCLLHEDFSQNIYFDYLIKFDDIDISRSRYDNDQRSFRLIKLHGSFDWGICGQCSYLHLYSFSMNRYDYQFKKCVNCGERVSPFIILPYEEYNERIRLLWEEAKTVLRNADEVIIIGYSFPDYDVRMRKLFSEALRSDVSLKVVDYASFGDDEDSMASRIKEKYKQMFPRIRKDPVVCLHGFEGYLNNLL